LAKGRVTIDAIVHMDLSFPRFIVQEYNKNLMEEVIEEELKEILHNVQKDKSTGHDGWSMDFFVGIFYLIGKNLSGVPLSPTLRISHLLFMDYVLILCNGLRRYAEKPRAIFDLFSRATGMQINGKSSTMSAHLMEEEEVEIYKEFSPFKSMPFDEWLKYLGFQLKPNNYKKEDWKWLISKLEKILKS
jgi:hypothetical protein